MSDRMICANTIFTFVEPVKSHIKAFKLSQKLFSIFSNNRSNYTGSKKSKCKSVLYLTKKAFLDAKKVLK